MQDRYREYITGLNKNSVKPRYVLALLYIGLIHKERDTSTRTKKKKQNAAALCKDNKLFFVVVVLFVSCLSFLLISTKSRNSVFWPFQRYTICYGLQAWKFGMLNFLNSAPKLSGICDIWNVKLAISVSERYWHKNRNFK